MDRQQTINQREWDDPSNWTGWLGAYRSKTDTRLWVPKRFGVGQALNVAHPGARVFLAGMAIIPLALIGALVAAQIAK